MENTKNTQAINASEAVPSKRKSRTIKKKRGAKRSKRLELRKKEAEKRRREKERAREKERKLREQRKIRERERIKRKKAKAKERELQKLKELREKEKQKKREEREKLKHKRRRGRPRKPGPKKKYRRKKIPKPRVYKKLPPFNYRIIECLNGVQKCRVAKYRSIEEAYEKFDELKKTNDKVIFPSNITGDLYLKQSNYEYVLLEKVTDPDEIGKPSILRNEFGKLVEHRTDHAEWRIVDKFAHKREEMFYMYGMNPTAWKERKPFDWIYANKVINGLESKYDFKRVMLLFNKIVIKDDNENMEIVFCKDESDAMRFYNMLEQWTKRDKIKQVLYFGNYGEDDERREKLAKEIMELTGWKRKKVVMKTTTYYSSARRLLEKKMAEESETEVQTNDSADLEKSE